MKKIRPLVESLIENRLVPSGEISAAVPRGGFPKPKTLCSVEGCDYSKANYSELCPYHKKSAEVTAAVLTAGKVDAEVLAREAALFIVENGFDDESTWESERISRLIVLARAWLKQNPGEREPSPPEKG